MLIYKCEVHYDTFYAFATATGIASQLLKLLLLLLALLPSCRQAEEHQLLGHLSATACDNKHRQASRQRSKLRSTMPFLCSSLGKPITTRCIDHNCTQHTCTAHLQNGHAHLHSTPHGARPPGRAGHDNLTIGPTITPLGCPHATADDRRGRHQEGGACGIAFTAAACLQAKGTC